MEVISFGINKSNDMSGKLFRRKSKKVKLHGEVTGDKPHPNRVTYDEKPYRIVAGFLWLAVLITIIIWIIRAI